MPTSSTNLLTETEVAGCKVSVSNTKYTLRSCSHSDHKCHSSMQYKSLVVYSGLTDLNLVLQEQLKNKGQRYAVMRMHST